MRCHIDAMVEERSRPRYTCTFNPFLPEFIISAEPLNAGDKMAAPGRYLKQARNATSSAFFLPKQ